MRTDCYSFPRNRGLRGNSRSYCYRFLSAPDLLFQVSHPSSDSHQEESDSVYEAKA